MQWLTIPSPSSCGLTSPSPRFGRHSAALSHTPSLASMASPSPAFPLAENLEPPGMWHVLLLRGTFEESTNTPERVVNVLTKFLEIDENTARRSIKEAQRRLMAVVGQFSSRSEAFEKAKALRKVGMVVQVASELGLPGNNAGNAGRSKAGKRGKAAVSQTYFDLFQVSFQGTDRTGQSKTLPPLLLPQTKGRPQRGGTQGWRGEGAEVLMSVVPEDPVMAFLDAENRRQAREGAKTSIESQHEVTLVNPPIEDPVGTVEGTSGAKEAETTKDVVAAIAGKPGGSLWSVLPGLLLDALAPKQKIPPVRKEACQMIRFFVFGNVGNESAKTQREQDKIFYEAIGSREQVRIVYVLWHRLDDDASGRVDIGEFRAFAEHNLKEKMESLIAPGSSDKVPANLPSFANINSPEDIPKFIARLCDKLAQLLLGKKSSFVIEDMMRLIWPCAQMADLKHMRAWCKEFSKETHKNRVNPPPILPTEDFEGLCSVFRYFDDDCSGEVLLDELVAKGLIYEDQAAIYFRDWDKNGDGSLDLLEFCEMMCPCGYRAHPEAQVGLRADGKRVIFDPTLDCWRIDDKD